MDCRVYKQNQVNYCRGPDKKLFWFGLEWMEKNVLVKIPSKGNTEKGILLKVIPYWFGCGGLMAEQYQE